MERSDQELLAAARVGDRNALEALLLRYQAKVYRFGMQMCRDPEDAKDVLQDTLLAMARTVADFRGASSLSTWLYTIARSFCIKKRRRGRSVKAAVEAVDEGAAAHVAHPGPGPEERAASRQVEAVLAEAIAGLAPIYREVLVLRDIEGLSAPEVAEVLSVTIEAVKSRLHRARLAIREAVAPLLGIGEEEAARPVSARCPDVLRLFSRHLEGEISTNLCAEMERHLERCGACRDACASLRRTLQLCHATTLPKVPEPIQQSVRDGLRRFLAAS